MNTLLAWFVADAAAPIGALWARSHERRILRSGQPLSMDLQVWARELGIEKPNEIRFLVADPVPLPAPMWLRKIVEKIGFPAIGVAGLCLRSGLYFQSKRDVRESTVRHELVHTLQYQRLGSMMSFMRRYVFECLAYGYCSAPLEVEARALSVDVEKP